MAKFTFAVSMEYLYFCVFLLAGVIFKVIICNQFYAGDFNKSQ